MSTERAPYSLPLTPSEKDEAQSLARIIDSPEGRRRVATLARREVGGVVQFPSLL